MKRLFLLLLLTSLLLFACMPQSEQDTVQDTEPGAGEVEVAGEGTEAATDAEEGDADELGNEAFADAAEETAEALAEPTVEGVEEAGEESEGAIAGTPERQETPEMQEAGAPDEEETGTPSADETPAAGAVEGTVGVGSTEELEGEFLVDAEGMSLYLFEADEQGSSDSTCYDDCAQVWPPFIVDGQPSAATDAVDESLLGTIEREDGSLQVTYNGWPLYYYQGDQQPGDITGHDIEQFGAEWYLVTPEGSNLEAEP